MTLRLAGRQTPRLTVLGVLIKELESPGVWDRDLDTRIVRAFYQRSSAELTYLTRDANSALDFGAALAPRWNQYELRSHERMRWFTCDLSREKQPGYVRGIADTEPRAILVAYLRGEMREEPVRARDQPIPRYRGGVGSE